jgi:hypothetical protein
MISVQELIGDPDLIAPRPFTILRSTGSWVAGGFSSVTVSIDLFGPVQQASNKEIAMLPEADRVGSIRSFWATVPIYVTRGYAPVPGVHGETPQGSGLAYSVSCPPPDGALDLYGDRRLLRPGLDYALQGTSITLQTPHALLYATWQVTVSAQPDASDILVYEQEQYRVLNVYRVPGSGYYKAMGTRMAAA